MKPSASSNASRPDGPTLFIDRSAWSNALHEALSTAGIAHEAHRWHFRHHDTAGEDDDSAWLRAVADRGWVVVTRDKNIRYRINELSAMRAAKLHVFVFTQGGLSAWETGQLLVGSYASIRRAAATTAAPAFFSISRHGKVNELKFSGPV